MMYYDVLMGNLSIVPNTAWNSIQTKYFARMNTIGHQRIVQNISLFLYTILLEDIE